MPGQYFELTQALVEFSTSGGDMGLLIQLARRAGPLVARLVGVPEWIIQVAEAGVDYLGLPDAPAIGPNEDGTYASPGADRVYRWLRKLEYGMVVVVGAPRTGKTCFGCRLVDRLHEQGSIRRAFIVGPYSKDVLDGTPLLPFAWQSDTLNSLGQGDLLLIPDAGLYLDATAFGSAADMIIRRLSELSGQQGVIVILDVQTSALLSKSALLARAVIYKPLGPLFAATERDTLTPISRRAERTFQELLPNSAHKSHAYAVVGELQWEGLISYAPPEWYSDQISRPHNRGAGRAIDPDTGQVVPEYGEEEDAEEAPVPIKPRGPGSKRRS
jgi:hypothetical protein